MKKKVYLVAILVILIGIIMVAVKGFNVNIRYRAHKVVYVPIDSEFEVKDIEKICKDVVGKKEFFVEKAGIYNDSALISIEDINDEQINEIRNKVNEKYNPIQDLNIKIGDNYETEDIKNIVIETLGKEPKEVSKDKDDEKNVVIKLDVLTETELEKLNDKINEKYNLTNTADSSNASLVVTQNNIPRVRILDMSRQYVLYVIIATIVILLYFVIKFSKLGKINVLKQSVMPLILAECLYMAIMAIVRFPLDKIVMLGALGIYMAILVVINNNFIKEENEKKEKKKSEAK